MALETSDGLLNGAAFSPLAFMSVLTYAMSIADEADVEDSTAPPRDQASCKISINWGQNYEVAMLTEASVTGQFISDVPTSAKRGSGKYLIDVEKLETDIPGQGVIKEASNLVYKPQTEYKVILHNIHEDKIRSNVIYDESEALETIQPTEEAEPLTTEFLHHEESKLDEAPDFMSKQECQAVSNSIDVVKLKEDGRSNKNLYVPLVTMDNVKETSKRGRVGASTTENEFTQKVHIVISEEKIPSPTESIGGVEGDDLNEDEDHQSAVKDPISRALYNARLEGQVLSQSLESRGERIRIPRGKLTWHL